MLTSQRLITTLETIRFNRVSQWEQESTGKSTRSQMKGWSSCKDTHLWVRVAQLPQTSALALAIRSPCWCGALQLQWKVRRQGPVHAHSPVAPVHSKRQNSWFLRKKTRHLLNQLKDKELGGISGSVHVSASSA
jgi:hypothetical protein